MAAPRASLLEARSTNLRLVRRAGRRVCSTHFAADRSALMEVFLARSCATASATYTAQPNGGGCG